MVNHNGGQRVGYVRVSTADQNPARQLETIGACDRVFTEYASGKDIDGRPQLEALIAHVRAGDEVVVSSMDRLARSVIDLNAIVQQITGVPTQHTAALPRKGATLAFLKENLTFRPEGADAFAQFQLNLMGAFAQFERDLIRQRQAEGIAAAKARGVYKGRRRALTCEKVRELRERADAGEPRAALARQFGISRATVYRYLEEAPGPRGTELLERAQ